MFATCQLHRDLKMSTLMCHIQRVFRPNSTQMCSHYILLYVFQLKTHMKDSTGYKKIPRIKTICKKNTNAYTYFIFTFNLRILYFMCYFEQKCILVLINSILMYLSTIFIYFYIHIHMHIDMNTSITNYLPQVKILILLEVQNIFF